MCPWSWPSRMTSGTRARVPATDTIASVMRHTRILMLAGLMVWLVSGIHMAQGLSMDVIRPIAWAQLVAWLLFGAVFFIERCRVGAGAHGSLLIQTLAALVLIRANGGDGVEVALLVMIAGQLPSHLSLRWCFVWILTQTAASFLPDIGNDSPLVLVMKTFGYLSFEFFALGAAGLAESERVAREELAAAKGRLEAMQERLAETTREAERLRIARELHDSLGHHLTALGLDLELARHLVKGEAAAPVERARALASSLMTDLRSAVTELRADSGDDLVGRLQLLARSEGLPRIDVSIAPGLGPVPSAVGLALARVSQEIATNATKHSSARLLRLSLGDTDREWVLEALDDGRGVETLHTGHGLAGMRERVEGMGGVLSLRTGPGQGFGVTVRVPKLGNVA